MESIQTANPSGNAYKVEMMGITLVAVYNSQINEGDQWWNLIQSIAPTYQIDRTFPLNRTLFFKTADEKYHVAALDILMNTATMIFYGSYQAIFQTITQKYLIDTIKLMGVSASIVNTIAFKLYVYNSEMSFGTVTKTILGRQLPSAASQTEHVFEFNDDWTEKVQHKCFSNHAVPQVPIVFMQMPSSVILDAAKRYGF